MSTIYRERDRERFDDSRTSVSSRPRGDVKVTRYVVREDDNRSSYGRDDTRSSFARDDSRTVYKDRYDDNRSSYGGRDRYDRTTDRVEETRIIRKERDPSPEPVREYRRDEPAGYSREEITIRRERDESPRREEYYRRPTEANVDDREIVIRRTTERESDSRDNLAVSRYEDRRESRYDDYQVVGPRGSFDDRDKDLQRYIRTAEYYAPAPQQQQPQTIIIRQEPIIIRERVRDDDYQMVRKSEVEEERSVVRRERTPPREEEYFYEKKVRERIPEQEERSERRLSRREVSPGDSISQAGRRRDYSSDDSMVYVRKETRETYEDEEEDGHRKRDLAAGVIAGVGAAELLRNHKKKEGKDTSHGIGRIGRDLGAGALGAVAAEGVRRARSEYRSRSRRRRSGSGSRSRYSRRGSRERSRSRSQSHSRAKTLGTVGLAAAALAAGAAIASKRMNKNKEASPDRGRRSSRSRSRSRRHSSRSRSQSLSSLENDPNAHDARNPGHRNARIAGAGAVGAAAAALIERARSKSRQRNGERERSKSRIRQGLPIAATALGSAALAGLYEKNKAKREAEQIKKDEHRARSRSRSRARSDASAYYDGPRQAQPTFNQPGFSDPNLIEYGAGPMYGNNFGPDYYGRPAPQENYYNNTAREMVPAAETASAYGANREARERSLSPDETSRSASRRRHHTTQAEAAAAAAGAGVAAAEMEKQRKRERRERRRSKNRSHSRDSRDPYHGRDPYEDANYPLQGQQYQGQYTPTPPPGADPYATQSGFYPQTSQFPPPPGSMPQAYAQAQPAPAAAAGYGAQNFPPPPSNPPPPGGTNYDPFAPGQNPYTPHQRGADENVSAGRPPSAPTDQHHTDANGVNKTRAVTPPPINISPPSNESHSARSSMPNLTVPPQSYVPPGEEEMTGQASVPEMSENGTPIPEKKVSFAAKPEFNTTELNREISESSASSPDERRQRRRQGEERYGYEAGDDFSDDTPMEDHRRRSHGHGQETSRSARTHDDHRDRSDRDRRHRRERGSSRDKGKRRDDSPGDSDATEDLPDRFDDDGKRKPETGGDPLASKIDEILSGKGTGGKLFGNFMDGFIGPDGKDKKRKH